MAISDMDAVLEFLRKNGLAESESALMEEVLEKSELRSFDFEKFVFPMNPPPPQLRIPPSKARASAARDDSDGYSSSQEFVSVASSVSDDVCSADFINPYGIHAKTRLSSAASSDRLSQFGTARDYQNFDMQNNFFWYNEKDEDFAVHFDMSDSFTCPSEDKYVMTLDKTEKIESQQGINHISEGYQATVKDNIMDKSFTNVLSMDGMKVAAVDLCRWEPNIQHEGNSIKEKECVESLPASTYADNKNLTKYKKNTNTNDWDRGFGITPEYHNTIVHKDSLIKGTDNFESKSAKGVTEVLHEQEGPDLEEDAVSNHLLTYDGNEEDYDVFNLRIIHRKNRTGFEENKDLPIVLHSVIAGRYYVTEYLGSAAFSKVVQAHDFLNGIDVCLKIIKNDKDFFDQSLDEIKLLKYVNKHDPGDERHILRLFDYFYYQEHLFIACELLRANLYEFQKYNQESGGEPYFTLSRLQLITRQCLEALEYLHHLGIIHCDLKPENILMKSYRRCEIKVIDLGSSCFRTDNLSLYVQSRSYRAPEVILGLPYDQKIDLWSLGCILVELCSGDVLFPNDTVAMLLARVIGMLGPIDADMLVKGQEVHKYFTEDYDLYFTNEETNQVEYIIPEECSLEDHLPVSDIGFIDFVKELLEVNPMRRPTAREALEHPWLSHQYGQEKQFS